MTRHFLTPCDVVPDRGRRERCTIPTMQHAAVGQVCSPRAAECCSPMLQQPPPSAHLAMLLPPLLSSCLTPHHPQPPLAPSTHTGQALATTQTPKVAVLHLLGQAHHLPPPLSRQPGHIKGTPQSFRPRRRPSGWRSAAARAHSYGVRAGPATSWAALPRGPPPVTSGRRLHTRPPLWRATHVARHFVRRPDRQARGLR